MLEEFEHRVSSPIQSFDLASKTNYRWCNIDGKSTWNCDQSEERIE